MAKQTNKQSSVAKIISILFFSLGILFMVSTALSYYRLFEFQTILSKITKNSLPEVIYSGKIYNKINELTFLTESLTNASSNAAQRIAFKQVQAKIAKIQTTIRSKNVNNSLENQLDVIINEVEELNALVTQKLQLAKSITQKADLLFQLHKQLLFDPKNNIHLVASPQWQQKYSELIVFTSQALASTKLQEIRQLHKTVRADVSFLKVWLNKNLSKETELIKLFNNIEQLLTGNNSVFALKIKQLRLFGRVRGRGNFVKNIADDFSHVAESQLYETNRAILKETQETSDRLSLQIKVIAVISLLVLLLLFFVVYFIKTRFVARLMLLNEKVHARLEGENVALTITGHDEISAIANSFNYFADMVEEQKARLQQLTLTDGLTGIANRRSMDKQLAHEIIRGKRNKQPLSVLLMDIDYFKNYNDNYGHLAGDECLKKVAEILVSCKRRATDFVARYGGEEFLFILPNTDIKGAEKFALTILSEINKSQIIHLYSKTAAHITLSVGVTMCNYEQCTQDSLLKRADKALYQAKHNGKNCFYTL